MLGRRSFIGALVAAAFGAKAVPALAETPKSAFDPKKLLWGTYGKNPSIYARMRIVQLGDCETDHLQNILRTEDWHLNDLYRDGIYQILKERGVQPIPTSLRQTTEPVFDYV